MALKIGNNAVANAFVGSSQVRRAYKGGTLVYQGFGPASEQEFIKQTATGGPAEVLKVYGKTIVWRQSFKNYSAAALNNGVTITPDADGYMTFSGTASTDITLYLNGYTGTPSAGGLLTNGHKVFIGLSVAGGSLTGSAEMNITASTGGGVHSIGTAANFIVSVAASGNSYPRIVITSATAFSSLKIRIVNIDLTDIYGAGNEPTSVAQFEADYPEYDPTYDPGSLQSNKTTELRAYDGGTLRGSLALNISTLTGKLNGEGASVVVYPDGMGGVRDVRSEAYGSTGINKFYAIVFDGTEASWRMIGSFSFATGNIFSQAPVPKLYLRGNRGNGKASHFGLNIPSAGVADTGTWDITDAGTNFGMTFNRELVPSVSTLADWKAWLAAQYAAGTPLVVVYEVATPLTYTLDTPLPTDLTCEQDDILQRVSDNNCPFVGEMRFGL